MSSLNKLGPNNGNSLNFDGASLQNQQEDEYRREEELQQNELRALLTNAFDDLSDEDDILSDITSDDGVDSRNVSLHRRHSNDSISKSTDYNKHVRVPEQPVHDTGWENNNNNYSDGRSGPQTEGIRLTRTAEFSREQLNALRASVESLPSFPSRGGQTRESVPSLGGQTRESVPSHSKQMRESGTAVTGSMQHHNTGDVVKLTDAGDHGEVIAPPSNGSVRSSVEDFIGYSGPYEAHHQEHYYHGNHVNHADPSVQYPGQQEQQYNHGHYYHEYHPHTHNPHQGEPHHIETHHPDHHGYGGHHNQHLHFEKIYQDRPYHTIGEREETEGGNVVELEAQYYHLHQQGYGLHGNHHPHHLGYYGEEPEHDKQPEDQSQSSTNTMGGANQPASVPVQQMENQMGGRTNVKGIERSGEISRKKRELPVVYKRDEGAERTSQKDKSSKDPTERQFMEQGGSGEQLAQLQILYQARGRKIEELNQHLETQKTESGREIRILKHQLSVIKGEKEGASQSVGSLQGLLQEVQEENNQVRGRLSACQSRVESLTHNKEELIQKLKTAETTIESLHEHLQEMGSSESLSRARQEHESVISGLQRKHETEIKHLQAERDQLTSQLKEQTDEVCKLKKQLQDVSMAAENAQVSRAETINRLTQSLEDSQRRCRNLLDSTSAQDLSQMKLQLQQALAARTISDEMCSSLQDELTDVKEQLQMVEAASTLGLGTTQSDQNDSMADLGIKRTLDFDDTPVSTPVRGRGGGGASNVSGDVVSSLKTELERCLVNNKKKRAEVGELKTELGHLKIELTTSKQRCEQSELLTQEQKRRIIELETTLGTADGTNAMEDRLKNDVEKLRREKSVLLEDVKELRGRLEEVSGSEERLTELNRELSKQIADMVKEYDEDKRQALDSLQRACEQVSETSRGNLRQELTKQHDEERQLLVDKYEQEVATLRLELQGVQSEVDDVKELYVSVCGEKDDLQAKLDTEWQTKLDQQLSQLRETLKNEGQESLVAMETEKATEIEKLKEILSVKDADILMKEKELEKVKVDILEMTNNMNEKENEVSRLRDKLTDTEYEMGRLREKTAETEAEVSKLKDNLADMEAEAGRLRTKLTDTEAEVSKLKDKLAETEAEVVKHVNEIDALNQDVSEQLNKSCEQQRDVVTLEAEITEKDDFIAEQAKIVEKLIADLDTAVNELDNFKAKARDDVNSIQAELDKVYADLKVARSSKGSELEGLGQELDQKRSEITRLKCDVDDKVLKITKLECELEAKRGEVLRLQKDLIEMEGNVSERFEKQVLDNVEKISGLTEELEGKCEEVNVLKRTVVELEDKCRDMETKCSGLEVKCEEFRGSCSDLEARCRDLGEQMKVERQELEDKCVELEKKFDDKCAEVVVVSGAGGEGDEDGVRREIERNRLKDKQAEVDKLKKELICLKYELSRLEKEKMTEVEKMCSVKQVELDNIVKKHQGELERQKKDLKLEMERVLQQKNEEISGLKRLRVESPAKSEVVDKSRVRDSLRRDTEENMKKTLDTRVAMAKVAWLEEHRVTRQTAIDNAVRLAEAELRQKMEEEVELKFQQRIEQDVQKAVDVERQQWMIELEERLESERESWREVELETEKLRWSLDTQRQLDEAHEAWGNTVLKPAKEAWKLELAETIKREKENWRCTELETEKLTLLREYEERLSQERSVALETARGRWEEEAGKRERGLEERWRREVMPRLLAEEREKWVRELGDRVQDKLNKTFDEKVEKSVISQVEAERLKLQKESEERVMDAIQEHETACNLTLNQTLTAERKAMAQKMNTELQERFNAEKKIWREMVDLETKEKLLIEKEKWKCEKDKVQRGLEELMEEKIEELTNELEVRLAQERFKIREEVEAEFEEKVEEERKRITDSLEEMFEGKLTEEKKKFEKEVEVWLKEEQGRVAGDSDVRVASEIEVKLAEERETIEKDFEMRLNEEKGRFIEEKNVEFEQKLQEQKEAIRSAVEEDLEEKLAEEKRLVRESLSAEFEERLKHEIENAREKLQLAATVDIEQMRASFDDAAQLDYEELRARLEAELRDEYSVLQEELEVECERTVERERELIEVRLGREVARAVQEEEVRWRARLEETLRDRLALEEEKWNSLIESHLVSRLHAERDKLQAVKQQEIEEEKVKWRKGWEEEREVEMEQQRNQLKEKVETEMRTEMEKFRSGLEEKFHTDLEHEVGVAVQEARDEWQKEYTRKMALNTTTANVSQGLLKQEIENLQSELLKKTESWVKEKQELLAQKETEKREALMSLREETDSEYQQQVQQHNSTLEKALKSAREHHAREKGEMEERYQTQMKLLQERLQKEKLMMERQLSDLSSELNKWRNSDNTSSREVQKLQAQIIKLKSQEEENKVSQQKCAELDEKVQKLTNEIEDLQKQNDGLTNEKDDLLKKVDKLANEIEEYKKNVSLLSNERERFVQKLEKSTNEKEGFIKKNKELTDEVNKLQKQKQEMLSQIEGDEKRVKELTNELQSLSDKIQDHEKLTADLQKAKDLLREFKDELTEAQGKCQRFRLDTQDLNTQLTRAEQNQAKIQCELDRLRDERSHLLESVKCIEDSYRADVTAYQQKLQEGNAKTLKMEKMLQEMKHKYRSALEGYRAAMEAENDEAMKAMKRKHESILEAMSHQHTTEREALAKQGQITLDKQQHSQMSVGDIDETVSELRTHYLDTVAKIKDDVLRHVTQINMRAAETVKTEIDKERSSTFEQIKDFYRKHAKQIVDTDNAGGDMERYLDAGLHAAQEALLSSAQSSRSTTPLSEDLLDTPRSRSTSRHAYVSGTRSRSTSRDAYDRDAGISPKGQRTVSFTDSVNRAKFSSTSFDDLRSPKSRILAKSPREANITLRGEGRHFDTSEVRLSREWNNEANRDSGFDTRRPDNRPRSAKLVRELRDTELRESRLTSARSARDLHLSLRERHIDLDEASRSQIVSAENGGLNENDKKKSRLLISTRDIHSGRKHRLVGGEPAPSRSRSVGLGFNTSSALTRPTSVPDLTSDDKEFSLWAETSLQETSPQFVTLRESRNASKSESNLSFSMESPRDAGETPTHTPRRHRKHFTLHAFPTVDQISNELLTNGTSGLLNDKSPQSEDIPPESLCLSPSKSFTPTRGDRKNPPLIQFRHGRLQNLAKISAVKSKSPHPDEPPVTSTPNKRSLSVQPSELHMDF